jgi:hypothetical protein
MFKIENYLFRFVYGVLCHLQQYFNYIVEETGMPGENHRRVASHGQTLLHNVVSSTPHH